MGSTLDQRSVRNAKVVSIERGEPTVDWWLGTGCSFLSGIMALSADATHISQRPKVVGESKTLSLSSATMTQLLYFATFPVPLVPHLYRIQSIW